MVLALKNHSLLKLVNDHAIDYPTPSNLSLLWNYGFLSLICLIIQVIMELL